jgi:hypothetical protein
MAGTAAVSMAASAAAFTAVAVAAFTAAVMVAMAAACIAAKPKSNGKERRFRAPFFCARDSRLVHNACSVGDRFL